MLVISSMTGGAKLDTRVTACRPEPCGSAQSRVRSKDVGCYSLPCTAHASPCLNRILPRLNLLYSSLADLPDTSPVAWHSVVALVAAAFAARASQLLIW